MSARCTIPIALAFLVVACTSSNRPEPDPLDGSGILDVRLLLDQTVISDADGESLVLVEIAATDTPPDALAPVRLAIVMDTSGSMEGAKMDNARAAAHDLIDRLSDHDELTLIGYADTAEVHVDTLQMRRGRPDAHDAVDEMEARGNTCTSCGLEAAYTTLAGGSTDGVRRVVLMSDGHANRGTVDEESLRALAEWAHEATGVDTTTIGLGRLHNELLMAAVAESGAAHYYFLHNSEYLAELLDRELASLHSTAVRDLVVRLRPGDGVTFGQSFNLGVRYESGDLVFDVGQLAVGDKRKFLIPLALPSGDMGRAVFAEAVFRDVDGRPYLVETDARLERSDDPARIEESIEARVIEEHAMLLSALEMENAMQAVSAGRRQEAVQILTDNQVRLDGLESATASPALQAEIDQMGAMITLFGDDERPVEESEEERGNVILYRAQSNERRRGTPRDQAYHAPEAFDMGELE